MREYCLRKIEFDDLQLILRWRNEEKIRKNMFDDKMISWQEHLHWFEQLQKNSSKDCQLFCIDGNPIGIVNFSDIDETYRKQCVWGFYVGSDNAHRGSGLLLAYCSIEYVFSNYEIDRIIGKVISFNTPSINFHKKLFFIEKEVLVDKIFRYGEYFDICIFELEKNDWEFDKKNIYELAFNKLENNFDV